MNEINRINTRESVTLVQISLPTILGALVVLVFVSVETISLAAAHSNSSQAAVSQSIKSDKEMIVRLAPNAAGIAPQKKMSLRELCKSLGPSNPTYPCYPEPTFVSKKFLYGFHTGSDHGKSPAKEYFVRVGTQRYFLTLDEGRQYSVDRCALAHDSFFWSREARDSKINDYNFYSCIEKVVPPANDPDEIAARNLVLTRGIFSTPRVFGKPLGGWRDLPQNAIDIPADRNSTPREISSSEIKPQRPATLTANVPCGIKYSGSFLDPRNNGECWQCPVGYNRTGVSFGKGVPAVTSKNACVKGEIAGFGGTFTSAKYRGKPVCPVSSFGDGLCYSCPSGYRRNPGLNISLKLDFRTVPNACIAN